MLEARALRGDIADGNDHRSELRRQWWIDEKSLVSPQTSRRRFVHINFLGTRSTYSTKCRSVVIWLTRVREFDVITFDCYGTLVDWESGIRSAFAAAGVDGDAALRAYAEIEPVVEHEKYRTYREVLRETAKRIAPHVKTNFLAGSLPSWTPFPDTNPS